MSSPPDDQKRGASLWRSRPILCAAIAYAVLLFVIDRGGDALGFNDVHKAITATFAMSVAFFAFGALNRTIHAGFAVLMGLIALVTAIGFTAMYLTNPALFGQVQ